MTVNLEQPVVEYTGVPDGPFKYVAEFGIKVGTFTTKPEGKWPSLMWHVPITMRGMFKPKELANYDSDKKYRTDKYGFVLCYSKTQAGAKCNRRAVNRYPRCPIHGGRIHTLDYVKDNDGIAGTEPVDVDQLTRYRQFQLGFITCEDLDDEEITNFGFRDKRGKIFRPKSIPREMMNAFTRTIYDRALLELKSNTVKAVNTLVDIMTDPANETALRLKAAESILDRNLGKAPQTVNITANAPWEEIFETIAGGTREASRERRGVTSQRVSLDEAKVLEAEVVTADFGDDNQNDTATTLGTIQPPNTNGDGKFAADIHVVKPDE